MPSWLSPAKRLIRNQQIEGSNPSDGLFFSKKHPKNNIHRKSIRNIKSFRRKRGLYGNIGGDGCDAAAPLSNINVFTYKYYSLFSKKS